MTLIEQSKQLILSQHPDAEIIHVEDRSSVLGRSFPPGTTSIMIVSKEDAWHVFWYQRRHLVLTEQDMDTMSIEEATRWLIGEMKEQTQ